MSRFWWIIAIGAAAVSAAMLIGVPGRAAPPEIRISAKKFEFLPHVVRLKRGEPVVLVLTSEDRIHGFKLTPFGVRADIVPGVETRIELKPDRAGTFVFLCDVFCGDGHEEMDGSLIVED